MAARGFCQHGKVWTTCPICGKEVIAAAAKRGGGARMDEFAPFPKPKKKVAEEEAPEEAPEAPEEET